MVGQSLTTQIYGIDSPLKSNTINEIYYSQNHLLYIATQSGFFVFNGHAFREIMLPNGISHNGTNIVEQDGIIYTSSLLDKCLYKIQSDTLQKIDLPKEISKRGLKRLITKGDYKYYISGNQIWAEHKNKTSQYTPLIDSITHNIMDGITNNGILSLHSEYNNTVILAKLEAGKLVLLNKASYLHQFYRQLDSSLVDFIPSEINNGTIIDSNGTILVDLNQYPHKITPRYIHRIEGHLIVSCHQGLYFPATNRLYLKDQFITGIVTDYEKNIWVSTLDAGLHKINLQTQHYPIFQKGRAAHFVFAREETILYSDRKGNLYHWNKNQNEFQKFQDSKIKATVKNIFYNAKDDSYTTSGNEYKIFDAQTLAQKKRKHFYGICRLDSSTNAIDYGIYNTYYYHLPIIGVKNGIGASTVNKATIKETPYLSYKDTSVTIRDSSYHLQLFLFPKATTPSLRWRKNVIGSYDSLLLFIDLEKQKMLSQLVLNGLEYTYVENDRLFVITKSELLEIDSKNQVVFRRPRNNGLEQPITNLSCNDNYIAISTMEEIHLLDASSLNLVEKLTPTNGIISKDCNRSWIYGNQLYANGSKGVSVVDLTNGFRNVAPMLQISTIHSNDQIITDLELDYTQNTLRFDLEVRSFKTAGQFYWRLNEGKWDISNKEYIELQNLQYGTYTLEVYYQNSLGTSSHVIQKRFVIHPPYWQTWWFQIFLYLSGFLILGTVAWLFHKNKQKNLQQENQFNQLKLQALQSQMNPHFIFNVLTAVQNLWLQNKNEAALSLQSNFAKLLRKIFQYSGQQTISVDQLVEFINNYLKLEQIRFDHAVDIIFEVDPSLYEEDYGIPPLLLQPIIENSFKHGLLHKKEAKELQIKLTKQDNYLYALIQDNGVGRKQEKREHKRNSGLQTTRQRLDILQASIIKTPHPQKNIIITDLQDSTNTPTGTRVEMWVPLTLLINTTNNE